MLKSAFILACAVSSAVATGLIVAKNDGFVKQGAADTLTVVQTSAAAFTASAQAPMSGGVTAIPKAADGHFWAEARVNSTVVKFLVDTGASVVALTPEDACRMGIDLKTLSYDQEVSTASGKTFAARVVIDRMGVGQSHMEKVEALVIPQGLSTSLLGMSYLGRLSRFEATPRSLILHP
ncbi:TIGR02281 family clan AA aspartic protease [Asticcacaulis sp. BYS171W]|uniref:TIGR02281 family clan AA aspartic protease n=1 Tax=Asticcacaulis aquaticus TaxID=2984212 RepID=A0ABT5HYN5_9CAUL|nr:TIGR02281 family clan AA aspartic protease [Asticcacaulis aquaticus]MDC7685104.1 TIGR02281 family clan AA aspartic protease [Asticcacaulis aquaticus]